MCKNNGRKALLHFNYQYIAVLASDEFKFSILVKTFI